MNYRLLAIENAMKEECCCRSCMICSVLGGVLNSIKHKLNDDNCGFALACIMCLTLVSVKVNASVTSAKDYGGRIGRTYTVCYSGEDGIIDYECNFHTYGKGTILFDNENEKINNVMFALSYYHQTLPMQILSRPSRALYMAGKDSAEVITVIEEMLDAADKISKLK